MFKWIKANAKVVFIAFTIGFILAVFTAPKPAAAMELNAAWRCRVNGLASTDGDTIRLSPLDNSVMRLPNAYMVWEKSGNPVSVRRFYDGVAETNWIAIPDGQSLVIPAPPGYLIGTTWTHVLSFKGAIGDTILYLPMDR